MLFAVVVLGLVYAVLCQEIGWEERLQNLCGVGRKTLTQLECGPMPNVMAALLNIGGALCSTPQSLADAHY